MSASTWSTSSAGTSRPTAPRCATRRACRASPTATGCRCRRRAGTIPTRRAAERVMSIAEPTRRWLLASAREALAAAIDRGDLAAPIGPRPDDPALDRPARVFVSWHDGPRLLGCIGTVQAAESLVAAVRRYAVQAGLHDPRTGPMTADELARAHAEIAVLGPER